MGRFGSDNFEVKTFGELTGTVRIFNTFTGDVAPLNFTRLVPNLAC